MHPTEAANPTQAPNPTKAAAGEHFDVAYLVLSGTTTAPIFATAQ